MKPVFIYTLTDPLTSEIRYVGATVQKLSDRLRKHMRYAGKDPKSLWLQDLVGQGLSAVITEVESVPADQRDTAEQRWIAHHRAAGAPLLNSTDGGSGSQGFRHSPESRAAMSAARLGRPSPNKGKAMSEEQKELLRQAALRQYENPAQREAVSRVHKGKTISEEHRRAVSEANKRRWAEYQARKS